MACQLWIQAAKHQISLHCVGRAKPVMWDTQIVAQQLSYAQSQSYVILGKGRTKILGAHRFAISHSCFDDLSGFVLTLPAKHKAYMNNACNCSNCNQIYQYMSACMARQELVHCQRYKHYEQHADCHDTHEFH